MSYKRGAVAPIEAMAEAWRRVRDRYGLFVLITAGGMLLASLVPLGLLMGPMMCGMFECYRRQWRGEPVRFEMLGDGFKSPTLLQSIFATLILMAAVMVVIVPFIVLTMGAGILGASASHGHDPAPGLVIALVAFLILTLLALMLVIGVLGIFMYPLIADRGLTAVEAVRLSARAALANLPGLLGLMLLISALSMAGVFCCYIGAFLVMPITIGAQFIAYEQVFGLADRPDTAG